MSEEQVHPLELDYGGIQLHDILFGMPSFGTDERDQWMKALLRRLDEIFVKIPTGGRIRIPGSGIDPGPGALLFEATAHSFVGPEWGELSWGGSPGFSSQYFSNDWEITEDVYGQSYVEDGILRLVGYEGIHFYECNVTYPPEVAETHYSFAMTTGGGIFFSSSSLFTFTGGVTIQSTREFDFEEDLRAWWGAASVWDDIAPEQFRLQIREWLA